jgi:hypothetical protein
LTATLPEWNCRRLNWTFPLKITSFAGISSNDAEIGENEIHRDIVSTQELEIPMAVTDAA